VKSRGLPKENRNKTNLDGLLEVGVYAPSCDNLFYTFVLHLPPSVAHNSI
jgi:hypothetical protein